MRQGFLGIAGLLVASGLFVSGLGVAGAVDAAPPAAPTPPTVPALPALPILPAPIPAPPLFATVKMHRFVPTAEDRSIELLYDLYPDCSARGPIVGRVKVPPKHGSVTFVEKDSFPNYPPGSKFGDCDTRKTPGYALIYRSDADYVGEDSVEVFFILPDGAGRSETIDLSVL